MINKLRLRLSSFSSYFKWTTIMTRKYLIHNIFPNLFYDFMLIRVKPLLIIICIGIIKNSYRFFNRIPFKFCLFYLYEKFFLVQSFRIDELVGSLLFRAERRRFLVLIPTRTRTTNTNIWISWRYYMWSQTL